MGKEKMRKAGFLSYVRAVPAKRLGFALLLAALSGCAANDQTFVGPLKPLAGTCDAANRATLQRHGAIIQFSPNDGVLTLDGTVTTTGQIATAQQTIGMDRKPYRLSFTGQLTGDTITGTYVTARCRYGVSLSRAASTNLVF